MYSYTSELADYESINNYLAKGKDKTNRPAPKDDGHSNNTRILKWTDHGVDGFPIDLVGIKLHNTIIVTYYPSGAIYLDTEGWKTVTTRDRINYFTPVWLNVWQERFIWYVTFKEKTYLFEDGMQFHIDGTVTLNGDQVKPYSPEDAKKKLKLKNKVDSYVKAFIEKFINHEIPQPGPGDCWLCGLKSSEDNKPWGDSEADHLLNHMKEKYYVPSLLYNAIEEDSLGLSINDRHNIAYCWKADGWESQHTFALDITKRHLITTLKRYINKRIGLGIT